jgi:poly-gamma-glutamate synthesis protein (capsule biosynthesis protein)
MTGSTTTLALAGDTMLGRGVAAHLAQHPVRSLFGADLLEVLGSTDGMLLNLECCISDRGVPWPDRVFHFRAPPVAVEALTLLGVRWVTLANNHALDYGRDALLDTFHHLQRAGIAVIGAADSKRSARRPALLDLGETTLSVLSFTDHPAEYDAGPGRPGVAYADLRDGLPDWLTNLVRDCADTGGPLLVSPHWGPNMTTDPLPYIRRAARDLLGAGATLVAGHSAHVFHGVEGRAIFDLGDFLDDYATDPVLRNDLGVLWLVTLVEGRPLHVEGIPLRLGYCRTTLAYGDDARWVRDRFTRACAALGTEVFAADNRLRVQL